MEEKDSTPKRRFLRISLRGLFVLLTIVSLLLGWKINPAIRQREAAEVIRKSGGGLAYDFQELRGNLLLNAPIGDPPGPLWLRNLLGVDFFANVIQVDCHDTAFEDTDAIAKLSQLEQLNLNATKVNDLSPLANLTKLHTLECRDNKVS